jgi:homoserine O-acetyltransferase
MRRTARFTIVGLVAFLAWNPAPSSAQTSAPKEAEFLIHDFHFKSGETMPELRMHFRTIGKPMQDATGRTTNAVLLLHGTGGDTSGFLSPIFAGVLFGPGQLLDVTRYFIILPDNIGHGQSSKPSDGLHAKFPKYEYDDMVKAQELLVKGIGVNHLRLILGTSMGCMHSWLWAEQYPDEMDAIMALACQPIQIGGRNRFWRKMVIDGIRQDPDWKNGDYTEEPRAAMQLASDIMLTIGTAPLQLQKSFPNRIAADEALDEQLRQAKAKYDANDLLYAVDASRNYDPSPGLSKIKAHVMHINSADDFINPPELGIAEQEIKKVKNGRFVLLPVSDLTHGHGTHTWAAAWKRYLKELLESSAH